MENRQRCVAFWFRRDLRMDDNSGLIRALQSGLPVLPVFIFDSTILAKLEDRDDARVSFIHQAVANLDETLAQKGSAISCWHGDPKKVWKQLAETYNIEAVYTNRDYEPAAIKRDKTVAALLGKKNIPFYDFKDQVIFEQNEVLKDDGTPYAVFTPYSRKWKAHLAAEPFKIGRLPADGTFYPFNPASRQQSVKARQATKDGQSAKAREKRTRGQAVGMLSLKEIGFEQSTIPMPGTTVADKLIADYKQQRDYPALPGTSRLGVHLRFGTISVRKLARKAGKLSETYLNELIWREFYQMILFHHPRVQEEAYRPAYDRIPWQNDPALFEKWRTGQTGYPIVDAGMRELNETGFMHNRVRMIVASFLCKHLLIDWRWGEAWFARKLLDFDLAANNGGWQWAAGSGCDAAPYFRVFSPAAQTKKFDKAGEYIRKWVPEFDSLSYPQPMIDHAFARKRVLETYKKALS